MKFNIPFWRQLLIVPPILVGVALVAFAVLQKKEPERIPLPETERALRVVKAMQLDVVPRALGYGTTEPGRVWNAVSEIKGRVTEVNDDLQTGAIVSAGDLMLKIDPAEYQLIVDRLQAEIGQATAQLEELKARKTNYETSIELEKDSLRLAEQDLDRLRDLLTRNAASKSAVDQQERQVLAQRQAVQTITSNLNLLPAEIKSAMSAIEVKKANLAQAELDVEKTTLVAPFDCRLGPVNIEPDQFVAVGQVLFEAMGTDTLEAEAQFAIDHMFRLAQIPADVSPIMRPSMNRLRKIFDVDAIVRFNAGTLKAEWPAKFSRLREAVDAQTRTLGAVVVIENPYEESLRLEKPPPVRGSFCEVELRGKPIEKQIVIPRAALRNNLVYVLNNEQRLAAREVTIQFAQSNFVVVENGLQENDIVIVSDPTPAIIGMKVIPQIDTELQNQIQAEATGKAAVR